jgi:HK97 family phage portal protein
MKILGLQVPFTKRSAASIPDDRYFANGPFVFHTDEVPVTPETAIQYTAVFAAVRVIAGNLATLPLITYKRLESDGKEKATKHPLYKLLKSKPNNQKTTSFEFREMITGHMLLYGNGYAQIIRNRAGDVVELFPMHPSQVTPEKRDGTVVYKVRTDDGQDRFLSAEQVLHIRAYRDSGLAGLSPIAAAKKAIEAGLSLESFGANFFKGGAFPSGVLEMEGQATLSADAKKNLRESWQKLYGGENRGKKVAVLEAGVKWKPMGIPQSDAQFLEQRRFGVEEISRVYGVPPHLLGDLSRSTNNNIEMQSQEFVSYCLAPWMERWEQAIVRDLLDGDDEEYFVKHQANALMRGDSAARGSFYSTGRQWGWFSINDIRKLEDMNPIGPEGDIYLSPMNMVPAGDEGKVLDRPAGAPAEGPQEPKKEPENEENDPENDTERVKKAFRGTLKETWQRVIRKEIGAVKSAAKRKNGADFDGWMAEFLPDHVNFASSCLRAVGQSYFLLANGSEPDGWMEKILRNYSEEVREKIDAWKTDPSLGYERSEDAVGDYWAERLLNYTDGGYDTAA